MMSLILKMVGMVGMAGVSVAEVDARVAGLMYGVDGPSSFFGNWGIL